MSSCFISHIKQNTVTIVSSLKCCLLSLWGNLAALMSNTLTPHAMSCSAGNFSSRMATQEHGNFINIIVVSMFGVLRWKQKGLYHSYELKCFYYARIHIILQRKHTSMVSCQKGPTRHAYAWQIGPFWQDTLNLNHIWGYTKGLFKRV